MFAAVRVLVLLAVAVVAIVRAMPAGLWDDVTGFFGGLIGDVGHAIDAVLHAVRRVIDWFGRLGQLADSAWDWMVNGVEWLGDRAVAVAGSVLNIARWIVTRWVPMAAHWALGAAAGFALGLFATVRKLVVVLVDQVVRWVRGAVGEVWSFVRGFWRTAWDAITKAANWIAHASFYVFDLVAHPDRLAVWVAGHIVEPVIRWLVNAGSGVARWLIKQALSLAGDVAGTLERVIASLL